MRIAIVHHWFVTRGGGERVAECIAALFPQAEHLDLRGFDLVLSSDSGPIKGVRLDPGALHICYCHSPMRYLWDGFDDYRAAMGPLTRAAFTATAPRIRRWDAAAAQRVTHFLANSHYVADRIQRCYHRNSTVIHPPIDLHRAEDLTGITPGDHYLCAGRLVAYKRTDLLIEACRLANRRLRIMGTGPDEARLRRLAGPAVTFLGDLDRTAWWAEYARCRALLFAADEDFGMVPLEAQACGRPVIAYGAGGSLETVHASGPTPTGAYFANQTAAAAAAAITAWEQTREPHFNPQSSRDWASTFATPIFLQRYLDFVLAHAPAAAPQSITPAEAAATLA